MASAPKLTAGALFLSTAVSIACAFLRIPNGLIGGASERPLVDVAALASPLAFLCACVLVFFRPVFGYGLGLLAGLIALPWLVWTELALYDNSWISLNGAVGLVPGEKEFVAFVKLKILSGVLIVISVVCSSVRLLPSRWLLRRSPLCQRTWPAFAAGFLVLAVWFAHSVMPYRVPVIADGATLELRILHVEKRGMRLHETAVLAEHNSRF